LNTAVSNASQNVVELKELRHARREELRILRRQQTEQEDLLAWSMKCQMTLYIDSQ